MNKDIYINIESKNIEPNTGSIWKDTYLKLIYKLGYLSISECYRFTVIFSGTIMPEKDKLELIFSGLKYTWVEECEKDQFSIIDKNLRLEFFVRFLLPTKDLRCRLGTTEDQLIYIKDNNKDYEHEVFYIPLKRFVTLFTYANIRFSIIMLIVGILIGLYLNK